MPLKYIPESLTNILGMGVSASTFLLSSFEKLNLSIPVELFGVEADVIQITSGSLSMLLTLVLIRYRLEADNGTRELDYPVASASNLGQTITFIATNEFTDAFIDFIKWDATGSLPLPTGTTRMTRICVKDVNLGVTSYSWEEL